MKTFGHFLVLLLAVESSCLAGWMRKEEQPEPLPLPISYGAFPLPLARTYVTAKPGTPTSKAKEMNSPFPDDFPPCVEVDLEDARPYKVQSGTYAFPSINALRIYRVGEPNGPAYKTIQGYIARIQQLLNARPESFKNDNNTVNDLPDYPPRNSAHGFDLHVHYVDAAWGSGIGYMTLFTQDGSNHASNDELQYIFQGISKDGQYYVAADFRVTHPKLANFRPDVEKGNYTQDVKLLSSLREISFTPSIGSIVKWLETLKIGKPK